MICVNCLYEKTEVINSRVRKNGLSVWRRRKCPKCQYVSTSDESTAIGGIYRVQTAIGVKAFETVTLILSIHVALSSASADGEAALPLSATIQEKLVESYRPSAPISSRDIALTALPVIKRFNSLAGSIYAARHNITESRPGRPRKG
jgi:transcriptional regulator NrdR family protein